MMMNGSESLRESLAGLMEERGGDIARALIDKAAGGDLKAFGTIREILGEGEAQASALPEDLRALSSEELRTAREYYESLLRAGGAENGR